MQTQKQVGSHNCRIRRRRQDKQSVILPHRQCWRHGIHWAIPHIWQIFDIWYLTNELRNMFIITATPIYKAVQSWRKFIRRTAHNGYNALGTCKSTLGVRCKSWNKQLGCKEAKNWHMPSLPSKLLLHCHQGWPWQSSQNETENTIQSVPQQVDRSACKTFRCSSCRLLVAEIHV